MTNKNKFLLILTASTVMLFVFCVCSILLGSVELPFSRILSAINGRDRVAAVILFNLRFPRLYGAILAGVGLSISGMLLQTVTDNYLCSPSIVGANAGAGFFVMVELCLFPMLWELLPVAAFLGAMLTSFAVLAVARMGSNYEQKTALILAGVAVSTLLNAGITFMSLKYPDVLSSYTAFSVGGFSGIRLNQLVLPSVMIIICSITAVILAPKVRLLCLGDESASSLGVNVRILRTVTVIIASALCAAVVSFAGLLGFIGLIVPHIVRRIYSGAMSKQLILCAIFGSIAAVISDLIGRTLFSPWELPVGIIMAFVGSPFFIYLIVRRRDNRD